MTGLPAHRVAYVVTRFPTVSETFILREIVEMQRLGMCLELFPLVRQRLEVPDAQAEALAERAHYGRPGHVLLSQLWWLARAPLRYLRAWWKVLRGNLSSPKLVSRALLVMPLAAAFARTMQARGVQHVHAHWADHPALAAYVVHELVGIPYSFVAHAHDLFVDQTMLREKIRAARFVVTVSEYNRRFLAGLYGSDMVDQRVHVVYCGVDTEAFRPTPTRPRRSGPGSGVFTYLCVARLHEMKGHVHLLRAFAGLRNRGVDARCLLVGDGEQRRRLQATITELDLGDRVEVLGSQPSQRVVELLAEVDAVALASVETAGGRKDGIPVALMEAMASGLPVVATDISGIPELVEPHVTGLLVPPGDVGALTQALEQLVSDPALCARLGEAGRRKVVADFDLRSNVARIHDLIVASITREPRAAVAIRSTCTQAQTQRAP